MAIKGTGSGQGKVRHFTDGIMVHCANTPCYRMVMYYDPTKQTTNSTPPWKCDSCTKGNAPFIPKNKLKDNLRTAHKAAIKKK